MTVWLCRNSARQFPELSTPAKDEEGKAKSKVRQQEHIHWTVCTSVLIANSCFTKPSNIESNVKRRSSTGIWGGSMVVALDVPEGADEFETSRCATFFQLRSSSSPRASQLTSNPLSFLSLGPVDRSPRMSGIATWTSPSTTKPSSLRSGKGTGSKLRGFVQSAHLSIT